MRLGADVLSFHGVPTNGLEPRLADLIRGHCFLAANAKSGSYVPILLWQFICDHAPGWTGGAQAVLHESLPKWPVRSGSVRYERTRPRG